MADEHLKYLTARITLDASDLDKAKAKVVETKEELKRAGADTDGPEKRFERIKRAADDVGAIGQKLSIGVTLPLGLVSAAASKAAGEFETTFTRMETLAGVSADEVAGLKDQVKALATETGRGPQELAEALYFIRSAGLDGAAAVDTLQASAKAAAVGLGETAGVADAVTSALNAYGVGNLTAADAVNVLIRTAREGKAEASELAPQFGRLLPVASALGVEFDQVGAGLAFLTRNSGDASLAATQLSGIMNALLKPSEQAADLLAGVGLSGAQVRKVLRDEGLLAALELLTDRFRGNTEALSVVFADVQGLQGALALTGAGADQAAQVFANLRTKTDDLGDSFAKVADDKAFKQKQALAEVQTALIGIGTSLAPVITKIAEFGAAFAGVFDRLPDGMKTAAVATGIVLAALGPVLSVGKNVIDVVDGVKKAATSLSGAFAKQAAGAAEAAAGTATAGASLGPFAAAAVGVTAVVGIATVAYAAWKKRKDELKAATDELRNALDDETASITASTAAAVKNTFATKNQTDDLARAGITYDLVTKAVLGSNEAQQEFRRRLVESGEVTLVLRRGVLDTASNVAALRREFIETGSVGARGVITGNRGILDSLADLSGALKTTARETLDQAVAAGALSRAQSDAAENTLRNVDGTTDWAAVLEFARAQLAQTTTAQTEATAATVEAVAADETKILTATEIEKAEKAAAKAIAEKAKALREEYQEVLAGQDAQIAYERAVIAETEALEKVDEAQKKVAKGGKNVDEAKRDLEKSLLAARDAMLSEARAAAEVDAKQRGLKSASDDAARSLEIQVEHLDAVKNTLAPDSPLRAFLDDYIRQLRDEIPRQIETQLRANVTITEQTFRRGPDGGIVKKIGGPIPGPRDAPVPVLAHGGEFVLSADVVDAIKRDAPTLGLGSRMAAAVGPAGAAGAAGQVIEYHYHANVTGSPVTVDERALADLFGRMEALYA